MRNFAPRPKAPQQTTLAKSTTPDRHQVHSILLSQCTIKNQGPQRLSETTTANDKGGVSTSRVSDFAHDFSRMPAYTHAPVVLQTKLAIGSPGDVCEQEADRIAAQVMRMPEPQMLRPFASGYPKRQNEQDVPEHVQTKGAPANDVVETGVPTIVHEVLRSSGQSLDPATRRFMEPRFGHDFSQVRVHADTQAAESARAVNALAYTVGHKVVFGEGQFAPHSVEGKNLLAHELAHLSHNSQSTVRRQVMAPIPRVPRMGTGTVDNQTEWNFIVEASEEKTGAPKFQVTLKRGTKMGGEEHPAKGPAGQKLPDIDFILPTPATRINGIPGGKFKIGWHQAIISPDSKNKKDSIISNYDDWTNDLSK